ncbi:dihydrodipicolinate reductase [Aliishimia ponticola]|uniref:Dihydrodipicolinate reductase n=1 Tax=Aliishimia ponticola TaxID=2499833 RepID=A0A4S4N7K1_9RHOB|nr:dihydrodipicolinate reductase [Aliishimia ponticola]THH35124.1 dihydrodipicolinate reductase [Aliishimia ponticola]
MKNLTVCLTLVLGATSALADSFVPVSDKGTFLSLVDGKELRNRIYGVRLNVLGNGRLQGAALGWDISGSWSWQEGYFCREMDWGGEPIPYNCQLVEVKSGNILRFTVDQGAGDSASFRLQ